MAESVEGICRHSAPVLFTGNCLMPPKASYADRAFITEVVSYPEMVHIGDDKDFTPVTEKALALGGYPTDMRFTDINGGEKGNDRLFA